MVLGCANKTIKVMVFFFNFLAFICGAALIVIAVVAILSTDIYDKLKDYGYSDDATKIGLYVVLGLGVLIALLGFSGCCGACCENQCLLGTFVALIVVLLIAQTALVIFSLVVVLKDRKHAIAARRQQLQTAMDELSNSPMLTETSEPCKLWIGIQANGTCCGLEGSKSEDIVITRCLSDCQPSGKGISCAEDKWKPRTKYLIIAGGTAAGFIVLQILALSFACGLCCQIRKERAAGY